MGRPFIRKGDVGDALDGFPSFRVELTDGPDDVIQVRVYGGRDVVRWLDGISAGTTEEIRDRLNHPDDGGF